MSYYLENIKKYNSAEFSITFFYFCSIKELVEQHFS